MVEKQCKSCGTRLSEFYNTSYLGCPDCYKYFRQEIIGAIGKIQGGVNITANAQSYRLKIENY